jgi:hypothetical protein
MIEITRNDLIGVSNPVADILLNVQISPFEFICFA